MIKLSTVELNVILNFYLQFFQMTFSKVILKPVSFY